MALIKSSGSQPADNLVQGKKREYWILGLVLLMGLVHGLIYVYLIPPWQHYDEPNHFEYSWLIASRWHLPQPGEFDQDMRRATAVSMIEHNFFKGLNYLPNLESKDQPIWIGDYSQFSDPPFYYLLGAIPLIAYPFQDVTAELYAVRMVSLCLYLVTILCAWGLMKEIAPPGHPLRLLVPLTLAMLPGFTDLMTAVNNAAGGVALFSLCLWGSLRMATRGFSIPSFLWAGITALLSLFTSATIIIAAPVFLVAMLFAIFRGARRWIAWSAIGITLLGGIITLISWGDPAHWYRVTTQALPLREENTKAVLGKYVFQVDARGTISPDWSVPIFQQLGTGQPMGSYTLGMWMWASEPVEAKLPTLGNGTKTFESRAMLGTEPVFFALPVDIKQRPVRVWVSLAPETSKNKAAILYYDGLVLADGERPLDQAPVYNDPDGKSGQWGGKPFTNMIQNASAEHPGPRFRAWVDRIAGRYLPDNTLPSIVLAYLLDWKGAAWHYRLVGVMLLETFWARFGWGHVLILGKYTYLGLGVFSLLAVLGTFMWLAKRLRRGGQRPLGQLLPWEACFLLLFVLMTVWMAALVRGVNYLPILKIYLPVARYAYPAIIPSVLIIALGWQTILTSLFGGVEGWLKRPAILATLVYVVLFLVLDIVSLVSIVSYYSAI